jgi:dipeptidyl aminopeptidase/acylaminoacyl peptidase
MKKIATIILVLSLFACTQQGEKKTTREVKKYSIGQFYENINVYGGRFSPDESRLLVTSNKTGIYNAYALPVDGSDMQQLTHSAEESVFGLSYFPEDERLLYSSDKGGNEISHIYVQNTDNSVQDLTPVENAKANFMGWTRDNKGFFYITNQRDPMFFDLYEMDINSFKSKKMYENNEGMDIGAISKDKKYLALTKSITTNNNEMYLHDIKAGKTKHISAHEGDANFNPQFFDLAGKHLFYLTNEGAEFEYLVSYNLETGEKKKEWETKWDIWYAYNSYNEKYRVIGVNEDAKTKIYLFDLQSGQQVDLPEFKDGGVTSVSISKSEKLMRMTVGSSTSPNNIYVYNFDSKELNRLTNTLNPEINPDDLVAGKVVRYKSFDGTEIPAVYYQPQVASADSKVPALVWVHGGPGGQSRLGYFALIQYLVNHGYAILAVNNRGSSGYGKTFFKMDDQNHGEGDLKDCVAGKDFLASTDVVDMEKVGIIGGSYGGYMVMAALTFAPEEFDVGVNIFGVTNWLRTLKSIPPYWESFREALYAEMGDPTTADSVRLYNISPLFHAANVTKPLMVLQGANDPRVLQVESDEIVEAVKANNVPVEYVLFEDEGHGFLKKENEIKGYGQIREFLDKYLKGE